MMVLYLHSNLQQSKLNPLATGRLAELGFRTHDLFGIGTRIVAVGAGRIGTRHSFYIWRFYDGS